MRYAAADSRLGAAETEPLVIWTASLIFEVQKKRGLVLTLSKIAIQTPANSGSNSLTQVILDSSDPPENSCELFNLRKIQKA